MTWSILARDEHGHFGVAIASRFFAVGALCVHSRRGVGALSTQALMNPLYGPAGIDAMARGYSAADSFAMLLAADEGREQRQVHLLPASGPGAAHTGAACVDWCGHLVLDNLSVAGNMLAGPRVIEATAEAYLASAGFRILPGGGLQQRPGPNSALGLIKFDFDNPFAVYLHDTPSKGTFSRFDRLASHAAPKNQRFAAQRVGGTGV